MISLSTFLEVYSVIYFLSRSWSNVTSWDENVVGVGTLPTLSINVFFYCMIFLVEINRQSSLLICTWLGAILSNIYRSWVPLVTNLNSDWGCLLLTTLLISSAFKTSLFGEVHNCSSSSFTKIFRYCILLNWTLDKCPYFHLLFISRRY